MNPQAGDIWEWLDPWNSKGDRWNAIVILIEPTGCMNIWWNTLCLESNEVGQKGTSFVMSFSPNTKDGWSFLA